MNKINSLRQEKDLNLKELADILGVSEATVSRWENGKSDIRGKNLKKLSDFFRVSESYLLGYTDFKNVEDLKQSSKILRENPFNRENMKLAFKINDPKSINNDYNFENVDQVVSQMTFDRFEQYFNSADNDMRRYFADWLQTIILSAEWLSDEDINNMKCVRSELHGIIYSTNYDETFEDEKHQKIVTDEKQNINVYKNIVQLSSYLTNIIDNVSKNIGLEK